MSMPPKQNEPDPPALEWQHGRQRRWSRGTKIGAAAVAAAIGVAVLASILGALGGQKATTPADETPTSAQTPVATGPTLAPDGADRVGLIGLPPVGATPSTPKRGELVLDFGFGHSMGDHGRFNVSVYADGRLIWQRIGDYSRTDEYRNSTGFLERRLTPEGVELVRAEVVSTGLVDHDLHLQSGPGLYFGRIDFRTRDRVVHVTWGDIGRPYSDVAREMSTPEQASALIRLDARLEDPASWLPASAWENPEITPYVPSGYSVCYFGGQGVGLSQVLALLPSAAEDLLRSQDRTREQAPAFVYWCSDLTNDEARALARILDDAGVNGYEDVFGLTYGVREREPAGATEFSLTFGPLFPHEG